MVVTVEICFYSNLDVIVKNGNIINCFVNLKVLQGFQLHILSARNYQFRAPFIKRHFVPLIDLVFLIPYSIISMADV